MKSLAVPTIDHRTLYEVCATQTGSVGDRQILLDMTDRIVAAGEAYAEAAAIGRLDAVSRIAMSGDEERLLQSFYERRMQSTRGVGRYAYDEIKSSVPRCPLCKEGEIYEVDHFLPQNNFCDLNVLPINLVPICHPCNHIKLQTLPVSRDAYFIHPYFDKLPLDVQWLFADLDVIEGGPVLSFWVDLDEATYGSLARRLSYHFATLKLASRFKELSASVLAVLQDAISQHLTRLGPVGMADHFRSEGDRFLRIHGNCLEAAAHHAAASSKAYCQGAFVN